MFAIIPQVLIVLSIAGIIVIVVRKIPGVTEFVDKTPWTKLPVEAATVLAQKFWAILKRGGKWLWHFILEVKELSHSRAFSHLPRLPETFAKIHFPKPRLKFLKRADGANFYLNQAEESANREDYAEAERQFIKAIEKDAHSEPAFAGLGRIYLAQKKYGEAIETYKFLIKHYPENDAYHANLGQSYHGQKLYDQAVEAYERAIELKPDNAKRYINLGLTLEAKRHLEEAILNYRQAVDLEKTNTQFMLVLEEALVKKGNKEEAEFLLEEILKQEPTNHLARERLMQLKF